MSTKAALQAQLLGDFEQAYGVPPTVLAQAPGRVNLIGEHTDYNDGFVLPCAIDFQTLVALRPRADTQVRVRALDLGAQDQFSVAGPVQPDPAQPWANYVRGVFAMMQARGLPLQGADIAITGDVPRGAGLSSSASLEVALAWALKSAYQLDALSPTDLALLAQAAENQFVGCQCGIMDQLIAARGEAGHALLIDCRSLAAQAVPVPLNWAVMIVHSRVKRGLVDSAYNERRLQCQAAAQHLGVLALRDASLAQLQDARPNLDAVAWRRARHVISENARTEAAAQALRSGDLRALGRLMAASHASMRDDFEITVPAIDSLVEILQTAIGEEGGARMTGGGFGGCVVALMPAGRVHAVSRALQEAYRSPQGLPGTIYVSRPAQGAGPVAGWAP